MPTSCNRPGGSEASAAVQDGGRTWERGRGITARWTWSASRSTEAGFELRDARLGGLCSRLGGFGSCHGGPMRGCLPLGPELGSQSGGRFLPTFGVLLGVAEQVLARRRVVKAHLAPDLRSQLQPQRLARQPQRPVDRLDRRQPLVPAIDQPIALQYAASDAPPSGRTGNTPVPPARHRLPASSPRPRATCSATPPPARSPGPSPPPRPCSSSASDPRPRRPRTHRAPPTPGDCLPRSRSAGLPRRTRRDAPRSTAPARRRRSEWREAGGRSPPTACRPRSGTQSRREGEWSGSSASLRMQRTRVGHKRVSKDGTTAMSLSQAASRELYREGQGAPDQDDPASADGPPRVGARPDVAMHGRGRQARGRPSRTRTCASCLARCSWPCLGDPRARALAASGSHGALLHGARNHAVVD